jgi:hypothetical protein
MPVKGYGFKTLYYLIDNLSGFGMTPPTISLTEDFRKIMQKKIWLFGSPI